MQIRQIKSQPEEPLTINRNTDQAESNNIWPLADSLTNLFFLKFAGKYSPIILDRGQTVDAMCWMLKEHFLFCPKYMIEACMDHISRQRIEVKDDILSLMNTSFQSIYGVAWKECIKKAVRYIESGYEGVPDNIPSSIWEVARSFNKRQIDILKRRSNISK
jgi:hypothetical protein